MAKKMLKRTFEVTRRFVRKYSIFISMLELTLCGDCENIWSENMQNYFMAK